MRKRLMLAVAFLALGSLAMAQDSERWLRLGQSDLDPRGERAEVILAHHRGLKDLVLGVDNASVRILDARIQLGNGTVVIWPIRAVLYPGQRTHVFRLPGTVERHITSLVLYYETGDSARRPRGQRFRELDRDLDRGPENAPDWNRDVDRDWNRDWNRHYGQLRPSVSVWGRD
jgi:hypothetical protein